jgi:hypothetical protein
MLLVIPYLNFFNSIPEGEVGESDKNWVLKSIYAAYCSSPFLLVLCAVIIIIIISKDYKYKLLEKNITDGLTRKAVYLERLKVICIYSVCYTIYNLIMFSIVAIGYHFSPGNIANTISLSSLLKLLICFVMFSCAGVFLIDLFKNATTAIILLITYSVLETILQIVAKTKSNLINYLPLATIRTVLKTQAPDYKTLFALIIYFLLFTLLHKRTLQRMQF